MTAPSRCREMTGEPITNPAQGREMTGEPTTAPAQGREIILDVRDVSFSYPDEPDRLVLQSLNLQTFRGECLAVLGESGTGKTTLLKLLCGLLSPTEGQIFFEGKPLQGPREDISLIFLAVLFQITIIIRDSTASLDPVLSDVMRSMKAGPVFTLVHLILPGILPGILTALKATLGTSVALLMITELFASTSGLGYFIMNSMDARKYPEMYSGILLLMAMSALIYVFLEILEKTLCRWRYGARDADPQ